MSANTHRACCWVVVILSLLSVLPTSLLSWWLAILLIGALGINPRPVGARLVSATY